MTFSDILPKSISFSSQEFNYTFKWVDDHKYGKRDQETGEWNGMMGELLAQVRYTLICFSLICLHCTPRFNASWFIGRDLFLFSSRNKIEVNRTFFLFPAFFCQCIFFCAIVSHIKTACDN